jgi:hypothetical protein
LSRTTQVLYSFWRTDVSLRSCTPPWQLGELHEPGPLYLDGWFASAPKSQELARRPHTAIRTFFMASVSFPVAYQM